MIEHNTIPKSEWGPGPWQEETDRLEWEYKGFPCLMVRDMHVTGAWCGYVALPPDHPQFEKDSDKVDVDVHGGLIYSDHCQGDICHEPKPGEPDNVWWVGFDCANGFDFSPMMEATMKMVLGKPSQFMNSFQTYRDVEYVKKEVEDLADQLYES